MKSIFKAVMAVSLVIGSLTVAQAAPIVTTSYDLPDVNNYTSSYDLVNWFSTGIIGGEVESFELSFNWVDQGWGNQKGKIFYNIDNSGWTDLGLVAGHSLSSPVVTVSGFSNLYSSTIDFAYLVGGGGGHELFIDSVTLDVTADVPAPATAALLLGGIALMMRRKKA